MTASTLWHLKVAYLGTRTYVHENSNHLTDCSAILKWWYLLYLGIFLVLFVMQFDRAVSNECQLGVELISFCLNPKTEPQTIRISPRAPSQASE
jgi:hypothetical protein